jgi:ABC-2 type transport system permease protein
MSELGVVFVTELARKFRSTIFWLATLGGMVAIAFLVEAPVVLASLARSSSSDIVLAGPEPLRDRAAALMQAHKDFRVVAALDALPARVTPAFLEAHGKAGAAIAISLRDGRIHLDVYPKDLSAFDDVEFHSLSPLAVELATGLSSSRVESASKIDRTIHPLDAKFTDPRAASLAHGVTFGLIFILYLSIVISSQSIMSAVAEEKTNRIAEILIATIDPTNLLYGKTFAAAVVAMAQIGLWVGTAVLLVPQVAASLGSSSSAPSAARAGDAGAVLAALDPGLLLAFAIFFVLGYLQYATIYAAAGSLVSRTEELGAVATPVILPVVGAFLVANFALVQPAAPIVIACSFIPFLSPFVIFTRVAISEVPPWQIALAVLVNIATVAACFWLTGRVYRVGMLLYGRLPSPRQILAALRA